LSAADSTDDLNKPLGQTPKRKKRFVLPIPAVMRTLAGVLGLCVAVLAGWILFVDEPFGGEPMVVVSADTRASLDPARTGDPHCAVRPGERSNRVLAAAKALWPTAATNPVAFWNCVGCGGCNLGCRYNRKTGGVHGARPAGAPRSYLMRAIEDTSGRVKLRSELQAIRFELNGAGHVERIVARDLAAGANVLFDVLLQLAEET